MARAPKFSARNGTGQFGFIAVNGWLDCRPVERDGRPGMEFTWEGSDEGDQVSGRGWAVLVNDDTIEGHLFFHLGDDSSFRAKPFTSADYDAHLYVANWGTHRVMFRLPCKSARSRCRRGLLRR